VWHLYTAFGLGICSELAFPELVGAGKAWDVTIRLRQLKGLARAVPDSENCFLGETANVGMFLVRDGREIIVDPSPGADEALLRTIILGPIFAVLLRQRGLLVLHASAIATNGAAIAFLGGAGCGKSTLALTFYTRGYGVITDDVMPVQIGTGHATIFPGYPQAKMWPDTAASLGYAFERLCPLHSQSEKRIYPLLDGFPQTSLPLKRVYVVGIGSCNEIEPLRPREAFVELVRNSRAVNLLRSSPFLNAHFHQCARLVEAIPMRRLKRQPSFSALSDVARLVEEDCLSAT
jgi:hypothetical protein